MRRLLLISLLALWGAAPAVAKPIHCKHGYVRHGHRCHRHVAPPRHVVSPRQAVSPKSDNIAPYDPPTTPEAQAQLAAFYAREARNAALIAEAHNPPPPPPPPPRPRGAWTYTRSVATCETEGQPAGKCLITLSEAGMRVIVGDPPFPLYVLLEIQAETEAGPEVRYAAEAIGEWDLHPWAPVSTEWWNKGRQPRFAQEDKGIGPSPLENNAVYVGTGELTGTVTLR